MNNKIMKRILTGLCCTIAILGFVNTIFSVSEQVIKHITPAGQIDVESVEKSTDIFINREGTFESPSTSHTPFLEVQNMHRKSNTIPAVRFANLTENDLNVFQAYQVYNDPFTTPDAVTTPEVKEIKIEKIEKAKKTAVNIAKGYCACKGGNCEACAKSGISCGPNSCSLNCAGQIHANYNSPTNNNLHNNNSYYCNNGSCSNTESYSCNSCNSNTYNWNGDYGNCANDNFYESTRGRIFGGRGRIFGGGRVRIFRGGLFRGSCGGGCF